MLTTPPTAAADHQRPHHLSTSLIFLLIPYDLTICMRVCACARACACVRPRVCVCRSVCACVCSARTTVPFQCNFLFYDFLITLTSDFELSHFTTLTSDFELSHFTTLTLYDFYSDLLSLMPLWLNLAVYKGRTFPCNISLVVAANQRTPIHYAIVSNRFVFLLVWIVVSWVPSTHSIRVPCRVFLSVIPGNRVLLSPIVEHRERVLEYQTTA